MYRSLFRFVKNKIPRISDTELIALQSGDTSIDRDILKGKLSFPKPIKYTNKFDENNLDTFLHSFDYSRIYPNDNNNKWIDYLLILKHLIVLLDGLHL